MPILEHAVADEMRYLMYLDFAILTILAGHSETLE